MRKRNLTGIVTVKGKKYEKPITVGKTISGGRTELRVLKLKRSSHRNGTRLC